MTLDRFADLRTNLSKTQTFCKAHLLDSDKWAKFIEKISGRKVDDELHWEFLQELKSCISTDKSYSYLMTGLDKDAGDKTTPEEIRDCISSQFEDYPHDCIDDYLGNEINSAFYDTISEKRYTEDEEKSIFDNAYCLFDRIRCELRKPIHAAHVYKEFRCLNESVRLDSIRLLSFYIKRYDYDIEDWQRKALDKMANKLGVYLNALESANERSDKWNNLKRSIDNMVSDEEKLKLLVCARTDFLQMSVAEQASIDARFAEKCQLEIDRIEKLISIANMTPSEYEGARTQKVVSSALLILFKKAGLMQMDNTRIAKLMGYLSGFSVEKTRQWLSSTDDISAKNREEIDAANKLLKNLNIEESISSRKKQ